MTGGKGTKPSLARLWGKNVSAPVCRFSPQKRKFVLNEFVMKHIFYTLALVMTLLGSASAQDKSFLETYNITTGERVLVKSFPDVIEAPNWTPDGQWLVYNSNGKIYKIAANGEGEPEVIDTGEAIYCNNDHLVSADGTQLAVSSSSEQNRASRIYIVPFEGGSSRLVTEEGPSYLHGWTPDGTFLTYTAQRDGDFNIYVIPAHGGDPWQLTTAKGLDDGPEYSSFGQYIWFNSVRYGTMQLFRMRADGSFQTQMTNDKTRYAWFPHVSPDGQHVVYLCFHKGDLEPDQHLSGKHVEIRMMPAEGGESKLLLELFGGQGTINVNSWAPDSERFAFVSYSEE